MGCIRVDKITEYLCEPLRKCLKVQAREDCLGTMFLLPRLTFSRTVLFCFFHLYMIVYSFPFFPSFLSQDDDPYVRKTAAVCVAKLHDINSQLVEDQGFLDLLKDLLSDSTPMVVANTVAALAEIGEVSPTGEGRERERERERGREMLC